MKQYRYTTRKADGTPCCAGDAPDHPRCPTCRAKAGTPPARAATTFRTYLPAEVDPNCPVHGTKARAAAPERKTAAEWAKHFAALLGVPELLSPKPHDYSPPDVYGPALAARRAAEQTPESRAEDRYREQRQAEFEAEYAASDARHAATPAPRALTASELQKFAPPNPYTLALAALKKETR